MLLGVFGALLAGSAPADELRPGYLEIRQTAPDTYGLLFKIPARGGDLRLAIDLKLPEGTGDVTPPQARFIGDAYTERRTIGAAAGSPDRPSPSTACRRPRRTFSCASKASAVRRRRNGCRRRGRRSS